MCVCIDCFLLYVQELTQVDSVHGVDDNVERTQLSGSPRPSTPHQDSPVDQGACY